ARNRHRPNARTSGRFPVRTCSCRAFGKHHERGTGVMRRGRKTKIVATLGPASSTPAQLKALFEAGTDVFRINMSHTPRQLLAELHGRVRALERDEGRA